MFLYTEEDPQSLACWRDATIRQKHGTMDILLYMRLRITTLKQLFYLHIFSCILMPVNPFQVFLTQNLVHMVHFIKTFVAHLVLTYLSLYHCLLPPSCHAPTGTFYLLHTLLLLSCLMCSKVFSFHSSPS